MQRTHEQMYEIAIGYSKSFGTKFGREKWSYFRDI